MSILYDIAERVYALESKGKKIIRMNIGEPPMETPREISEAGKKAIDKGRTKYSSSSGIPKLRERIAEMHNVEKENVVITPGSKYGVYATLLTLLKDYQEGKENVLLFAPYWGAYKPMIELAGGKAKIINLSINNGWMPDLKVVKEEIENNNINTVIINNPSNPTSVVWDKRIESKIIKICRDYEVNIIYDDAYRGIMFEKQDERDANFVQNERNGREIVISSFSKNVMMSGWRIGYVIASKEIVDKITKINQLTITNVPEFVQYAALEAIPRRKEISKRLIEISKRGASVACSILKESGIDVVKPGAGFYIFPNVKDDGIKICYKLIDNGYATVPGIAFGERYKTYLRISICYPEDIIENGITTLINTLH